MNKKPPKKLSDAEINNLRVTIKNQAVMIAHQEAKIARLEEMVKRMAKPAAAPYSVIKTRHPLGKFIDIGL
jgi:hypothetical protein